MFITDNNIFFKILSDEFELLFKNSYLHTNLKLKEDTCS